MRLIKYFATIPLLIGLSASIFASGVVYNPINHLQMIVQLEQLEKQYETLKSTYQNAEDQLSKAKEIAGDAEGHYGYGNLLNSAADLKNREWSPDTWKSAIKRLSGGNQARYDQLMTQYQNAHKVLSQSDYQKGANKQAASVYQRQIDTNQAANVNATYAFNNIKTHLANIHQISDQIESAKNNKAAIDLSTRMETEMAYVQVQILKQMAILNEQFANNGANSIADKSAAASFDALPN